MVQAAFTDPYFDPSRVLTATTVGDLFRHSVSYPTPSPLASPLVLKWGHMQTPGGLFRAWAHVIVVLTADGFLHVFDGKDDIASAPPAPLYVAPPPEPPHPTTTTTTTTGHRPPSPANIAIPPHTSPICARVMPGVTGGALVRLPHPGPAHWGACVTHGSSLVCHHMCHHRPVHVEVPTFGDGAGLGVSATAAAASIPVTSPASPGSSPAPAGGGDPSQAAHRDALGPVDGTPGRGQRPGSATGGHGGASSAGSVVGGSGSVGKAPLAVPVPVAPTLEDAVRMVKCASRVPDHSVVLGHCKLQFGTKAHEHALELEERVTSMLLFSSSRKLVLRADSPGDMLHWMQLLSASIEAWSV